CTIATTTSQYYITTITTTLMNDDTLEKAYQEDGYFGPILIHSETPIKQVKNKRLVPSILKYKKNGYTSKVLNKWQYHQTSKFEHIYYMNIMIQISQDIWESIKLQKPLCVISTGQRWERTFGNMCRRVIPVKGINRAINNQLDFSTL